jgi:hypothetical protein
MGYESTVAKNWKEISALVPGLTKKQCCGRCRNALDLSISRANGRTGHWTADEDKKLKNAVPTYGDKNWEAIAALVPGRTKCQCTDDEDKHMATLLKKIYAFEGLPGINLKKQARDVGAILRLNVAGHRFLVEDGSSISKGVEVWSMVNTDINCVFLHILEKP